MSYTVAGTTEKTETGQEARYMIGKTVTVIVDRPLGSVHPKYPNLRYPVNYGYVPGVPAPDGEDQDAYILGVSEPVETFTGQVLAVIHRQDDAEDKWVVVPEGTRFTQEEIRKRVHFQEQFFQTEIELQHQRA